MDLKELKETSAWQLYERCRNYARTINIFSDTDKNYRMYNGNQWAGLKISGIEPVQLNFIKPIVKYKVGIINQNLYAINYSSENFELREFRETANKTCKMLNKKAAKVWEKDNLDYKVRKISKDSAINDEGIMYVDYDKEKQIPINEILSKNDVFYGNENNSDIQSQPYIIIKQRLPIIELQEIAKKEGVPDEDIQGILGDNDTFEEAGENAKYEKDNMCTLITKMYKKDGTVYYEKSTRYCEIKKETNSGLTYYPVAHMPWEEKEGSARGEGEVRHLIPNQLEVNKTIMRRLIVAKQTAYPQKVVAVDKIQNKDSIDKVGGLIQVKGQDVEDVRKIFNVTQPAQMSPDVEKVMNELISTSRELANAGSIATGDVNPEDASGKAILAVQQASQQPLVEQLSALKAFIEDLARIWLDMITAYSVDGIILEDEEVDETTGETITRQITVQQTILQQLQATVKVDITPKGAFDKYAQEVSLENMLKAGYFSQQRLGELKIYVETLDDDSVMPKQKLLDAIKKQEEAQSKIAMINAQANEMMQRANQFLNGDILQQVAQMQDAQNQIQQERQAIGNERNNISNEPTA